METIKATVQNRKELREFARFAIADYSRLMGWLLLDEDGNLSSIWEAQGQTEYVGSLKVIAAGGDFYKAHGAGAAADPKTGKPYRTQREWMIALLGVEHYARIFGK